MAALCTEIHCSGEIRARQESDSKRKSVKSEVFARSERVKQLKEVDAGSKEEEEERGEAQGKQRERKKGGGQSNNTESEEAPSLFFFFSTI